MVRLCLVASLRRSGGSALLEKQPLRQLKIYGGFGESRIQVQGHLCGLDRLLRKASCVFWILQGLFA